MRYACQTARRSWHLDQERWRRVEELFHAALERVPEARQAFLSEACKEHPEVLRQVELLLAKEEQAGSSWNDRRLTTLMSR